MRQHCCSTAQRTQVSSGRWSSRSGADPGVTPSTYPHTWTQVNSGTYSPLPNRKKSNIPSYNCLYLMELTWLYIWTLPTWITCNKQIIIYKHSRLNSNIVANKDSKETFIDCINKLACLTLSFNPLILQAKIIQGKNTTFQSAQFVIHLLYSFWGIRPGGHTSQTLFSQLSIKIKLLTIFVTHNDGGGCQSEWKYFSG